MLVCCGAASHQWEKHEVERRWLPYTLKCLIIGENPGDKTSQYFYEKPLSHSSRSSSSNIVRRMALCYAISDYYGRSSLQSDRHRHFPQLSEKRKTMNDYIPCPKCGGFDIKKVDFTLWCPGTQIIQSCEM